MGKTTSTASQSRKRRPARPNHGAQAAWWFANKDGVHVLIETHAGEIVSCYIDRAALVAYVGGSK